MRRLYVTTKAVMAQHRSGFSKDLTTYWMGLIDNTKTGWLANWMSAGQPIVVTTEIPTETEAIKWEDHKLVTNLPHPTYEGTVQLKNVMKQPANENNTLDGIALLTAPANLGITVNHTIIDVHKQLAKFHTMFRLRMGAK